MKASFVGCTEASADGNEKGRREVSGGKRKTDRHHHHHHHQTIKPSHHHGPSPLDLIILFCSKSVARSQRPGARPSRRLLPGLLIRPVMPANIEGQREKENKKDTRTNIQEYRQRAGPPRCILTAPSQATSRPRPSRSRSHRSRRRHSASRASQKRKDEEKPRREQSPSISPTSLRQGQVSARCLARRRSRSPMTGR